MKYAVIQRGVTNAKWLIRFLDSGDTEILSLRDSFDNLSKEEENTVFEHENIKYLWQDWASASLWKRVWIDDEQGNGSDVQIDYFEDFSEAFRFLEGLLNN